MAFYNWAFSPFWYDLAKQLEGSQTVIELGSGKRSPFRFCNKPSYSLGVEVFKPYILESRISQIHDDYLLGDITRIDFAPRCVDTVICLSVLEHIPKNEGIALLEKMGNWARLKSILYVPNGEWGQEAYDDNPYQEHVSSWHASELRQYGYSIYPVGGFKSVAEIMASPRMQPYHGSTLYAAMHKILRDMGQKLQGGQVDRSVDLFCVKTLGSQLKDSK